MSILTAASGKSVFRGYDYFIHHKVLSCTQVNGSEWEGIVQGSLAEPYKVRINLKKPRSSVCDCPFADGRRICKHMVAVYFSVCPDEAEKYQAELDSWYEEEERKEAADDALPEYVSHMTKSELQQALLQVLYDGPEWQLEEFIQEHIEYADEYEDEDEDEF